MYYSAEEKECYHFVKVPTLCHSPDFHSPKINTI